MRNGGGEFKHEAHAAEALKQRKPGDATKLMMVAKRPWQPVIEVDAASGVMTPEQIMDKLEARVGPKGRKLFEQFLRKVNKLHAQQYLEAQAQRGDTERSSERGQG